MHYFVQEFSSVSFLNYSIFSEIGTFLPKTDDIVTVIFIKMKQSYMKILSKLAGYGK